MKHYPAGFTADAVALYRSRAGAAPTPLAYGVNRWSRRTGGRVARIAELEKREILCKAAACFGSMVPRSTNRIPRFQPERTTGSDLDQLLPQCITSLIKVGEDLLNPQILKPSETDRANGSLDLKRLNLPETDCHSDSSWLVLPGSYGISASTCGLDRECFLWAFWSLRENGYAVRPSLKRVAKTNLESDAQGFDRHGLCDDFFGSGTVSGPEREQYGSLIEVTWAGEHPLTDADGGQYSFLRDGRRVTLRGSAPGPGGRTIGFGECTGRVLPAT